jgi:hypothetical protein
MKLILRHTLLAIIAVLLRAPAAANGQYYFFVEPFSAPSQSKYPHESFVIEVNQTMATQLRNIIAAGDAATFRGHVAAGSVPYNRNYHAPGNPVWNWHVGTIDKVLDMNEVPDICACPYLHAKPSDIAANPNQWIQQNGDLYQPIEFYIRAEINLSQPTSLVNVSTRCRTGDGENTAITGFVINGGQPRSVIIRALGPSLAAYGIQQFLSNPQMDVYQGATKIAHNSDWKKDGSAAALAASYPWFAPSDDREAAVYRTLLPGVYTIHSSNEDTTHGVVLTEVYDVGASNP